MIPYEKIEKKIKKLGFTKKDNISDFWFANSDRLRPRIYGRGIHNNRFGTQVRWHSEIGKSCKIAIIEYITKTIETYQKQTLNEFNPNEFKKILSDKKYKNLMPHFTEFPVIDFKEIRFKYKDRELTLEDFEYSFPLERSNYIDLSGIDLTGIELNNCVLRNVSFSHANFTNARFFQVTFENCNLGYCNFKKARLISVKLNHTLISGQFECATINMVHPFNQSTINLPFTINKISYWKLMILSLKALRSKGIIPLNDLHHTHFLANRTDEIISAKLSELKNYIDWYQNTMENLNKPGQGNFLKRFKFFLAVLLTKNWTSFAALGFWFLIVNVLFSFGIYYGSNHFTQSNGFFEPDFFQAFYHSIITFSVLGYGDLSPVDNWGRPLVLGEALIGFVVLGLFIFLLSRKIEKRI